MKRCHIVKGFMCALILIMCCACQPKHPEGVVSPREMEEVLYDVHLAQAMARTKGDSIEYLTHLYTMAALQKHHLSMEEFDRSLTWYTRHSDKLFEIYTNVDERYAELTSGMTWSAAPKQYATSGDTANIWMGRNQYLLTSGIDNHFTFSIPVDTMVSVGDKLEWMFHTQWMYPDGQKNATALLAVRYDNDSVQFVTEYIITTGRQRVQLRRVADRKVKAVEGVVFLQSSWSAKPRMLQIYDPVLLRYKYKPNNKPVLKMQDI